jgi:nicotinic acid mononucleotide adenylyltransferase
MMFGIRGKDNYRTIHQWTAMERHFGSVATVYVTYDSNQMDLKGSIWTKLTNNEVM